MLLAGCAKTDESVIVSTTKYNVVMPSESMFVCPSVTSFPQSQTLTDLQVASLLTELFKYNQQCHNSIQSIKLFLDKAKERVEQ